MAGSTLTPPRIARNVSQDTSTSASTSGSRGPMSSSFGFDNTPLTTPSRSDRGGFSGEDIDIDVVPPYHEARTLVLCFDGTGDQFDSDVCLLGELWRSTRNLMCTRFAAEFQCRVTVLDADEGSAF